MYDSLKALGYSVAKGMSLVGSSDKKESITQQYMNSREEFSSDDVLPTLRSVPCIMSVPA
jgi:hypothetical protein